MAVPEAVWQEVTAGGHEDVAVSGLRTGWVKRLPVAPLDPVVQAWDLGAGEASELKSRIQVSTK